MKIIRSFVFAWNGLKICFASETNFKIHVTVAICTILLAIVFTITPAEWLLVIICHAFIFLIWNLFLAWIPFTLSAYFKKMSNEKKWKQLLLFAGWFIFFPNALYIVTDLIHLEMETSIPKWYDALLLFSSSIAGLLMAFVSLLRVERYLLLKFSSNRVHAIIISILFFGSFGVYLGRFLRWNSWDVISNPLSLFFSISLRFIHPFKYVQTWGITLLFTMLFYLLYLTIKTSRRL